MMKKIMLFFFMFVFIPAGNALAQGELPEFSGSIVPQKCIGSGPFDASGNITCGSCELLQLAQNIINFFIFFAVVTAVLMFVYAGFKYITAVGNPGQISSAHKIFWNVFIGLVIILAAWLIIDLFMVAFYKDSKIEKKFGPWNEILCVGSGGGTVGTGGTGGGGVVVAPPSVVDEYTEAEARGVLTANGIPVNKDPCPAGVKYQDVAGGCTSLEGVKKETIDGLLVLQQKCEAVKGSTCDMVVTGGTELGHAPGAFSHENGYKIDLRTGSDAELDSYLSSLEIKSTIVSGSNFYEYIVNNEGDHWDILVFKTL